MTLDLGWKMKDYKLGVMETKFAELIWDNEPIPSGDLAKLCEKNLTWKKSTTCTTLRRLRARDFQNKDSTVSSLMNKQEFVACKAKSL